MQKIDLKTLVQYLVFLGLGVGLIWYSSKDLTPDQVEQLKSSWKLARFGYLIPVVVAILLSHFSRTLRWKQLMKPLGYQPGTMNTYLAVLIGYFFNTLVPRLGEVMKCTILAKYENVAPEKLVGTILAERAVDFISLVLVAAIMVIIQFDTIGQYAMETFTGLARGKGGEFSAVRLMVMVVAIAAVYWLVRWLFKRYAEAQLVKRIKAIGIGIVDGLKSLRYIDNWPLFIFHSVFIWAMYLMAIWMGFLAFPPVSHLGFSPSLSVLVFGSLGMIATQGGIGAYQLAVEKTLLKFGITSVMGLAFGWLLWGSQTAIVLISGVLSMLLLPAINTKKARPTQS